MAEESGVKSDTSPLTDQSWPKYGRRSLVNRRRFCVFNTSIFFFFAREVPYYIALL